MSPSAITRKYLPRLKKLAKTFGQMAADEGLGVSEPDVMNCDARVWMSVVRNPKRHPIMETRFHDYDVQFDVDFSENHDGVKSGVNFSIHCSTRGGRIVGGLTPYNYGPECWVPRRDADAVEERFELLEQADHYELLYLILQDIDRTRTTETLWGEVSVESGMLYEENP